MYLILKHFKIEAKFCNTSIVLYKEFTDNKSFKKDISNLYTKSN